MNGKSLNFVGTMKHRNSAREELLTEPKLLSDWAVQGGLVDAAIDVTDDDLVAAIELREAIYRTVTARLDGRRLQPADVDLLNERASGAQLTPRLLRTGATRRDGTPSQLLATLAADLLDLLAGADKIERSRLNFGGLMAEAKSVPVLFVKDPIVLPGMSCRSR